MKYMHPSPFRNELLLPIGVLAAATSPQPPPPFNPLARPNNSSLASATAKRLAQGKPVAVGQQGQISNSKEGHTIAMPKGNLAAELPHSKTQTSPFNPLARPTNSSLAKSIAKKIKNGEPTPLGQSGSTTNTKNNNSVSIPKNCQLAAQWYQQSPQLLDAEIDSMRNSIFSDFVLKSSSDGNYYWEGYIRPGIMQDGCWHICAVYPANFPTPITGGTMRVYLIDPTLEDIEQVLQVRLHHVIPNFHDDSRYLCTARLEDVKHIKHGRNVAITGAVTSLVLATKWLTALELVLTGHMSLQLFNSPGGI